MQRLNAREYYVVVLMSVVAIILSILLVRELFSETSPFVSTGDGKTVYADRGYMLNLGQTLVQLTICIIAVFCLLMRRRAGWVAAFALMTLYTFLSLFIVSRTMFAGIFDILTIVGLFLGTLFLLALIFLIVPSTLRKFNITRSAIIPVVVILLLLGTIAYFSTG